jgi:peroxiredoxin
MENLRFRKRLYCLVAAFLSLFVWCGNNLYATNNCESGEDLPIEANDSPQTQSAQELEVGTAAPDFTLTSIDGKSVRLSDFLFRYVVLSFWVSSSPESRKINAEIAKLEETYKNADIAFVGVSLDVNNETWKAAVKQDGLKGPQVSELKNLENADITKLYGVGSIPAVYIINPDGIIISIESGNMDLSKKLKDIFGI